MDADGKVLKPLPMLVMLVPERDLTEPWLRWLHARLCDRLPSGTRIVVHAMASTSSRFPTRSTAWACLQGVERRMAQVEPWPVHPDVMPANDLQAMQALSAAHRIVLDLTGGSLSPGPFAQDERWCLIAGGERLSTANWRIGYADVEKGAATSELLLIDGTRVADPAPGAGADPAPVLARLVQDTRWCGALNRRVLLGNVPVAIDKALQHWRRDEQVSHIGQAALKDADTPSVSSGKVLAGHLRRLAVHEGRQRRFNLQRRLGHRPGMWSLFVGRMPVVAGGTVPVQIADPCDSVECRPEGNDYWADPFLWQRDGRYYLYYEAYDYRTMRGRIAVAEVTADRRLQPIGDALAPTHHLSYPFLIEHNGELLMIPESSALKRVEIFRCTAFPDTFERIATCFDGLAIVDLTLFCRAGQWWAFCSMGAVDGGDANGQLYAFAVDGPMMRTIVPHARNPIVTDSRVARPGGRVFEQDGRWYRPSQDNSHGTYGYALNLMRIHVLTLDDYHETCEHRFEASFAPDLIGVHHLDGQGELSVIDACHAVGGRPSRRA